MLLANRNIKAFTLMDYKTSSKTIEICTCIDSPCSDNLNIEKYETQWE